MSNVKRYEAAVDVFADAIKKLEYHARTARNCVTRYTADIAEHEAQVMLNNWSTIDADNCLRLIDEYNSELDSYTAALEVLKNENV